MINDLKELERFFKICRKQGVTEISCMGITAKLMELPYKNEPSEASDIQTDELTPEQLMFYAVEPVGK